MRPLASLLVVALLLAGCARGQEIEGSGEAPSWSFIDTERNLHTRDSSMGQPTLLFFMATWCTKCQSMAPRLAELHHEYMGGGLNLYTLSHDPTEDAQDLRDWKARYGQMWPHGVDQGGVMAKTFGITRQSSIVILDADGAESKKWIYSTPSVAELDSAIKDAAS